MHTGSPWCDRRHSEVVLVAQLLQMKSVRGLARRPWLWLRLRLPGEIEAGEGEGEGLVLGKGGKRVDKIR